MISLGGSDEGVLMCEILVGMFQNCNTALSVLDSTLAMVSERIDRISSKIDEMYRSLSSEVVSAFGYLGFHQVIRLFVYKAMNKRSYRELETDTKCNIALRLFASLGGRIGVSKSVLQNAIIAIPAEVIRVINAEHVGNNEEHDELRIDSTAIPMDVARPENNSLLFSCINRFGTIVVHLNDLCGQCVSGYEDDIERAKFLSYNIRFEPSKEKRLGQYAELMETVSSVFEDIPAVIETFQGNLPERESEKKRVDKYQAELFDLADKLRCVNAQTMHWLFGEKVQADDKLLSVAVGKEHTDVIQKSRREVCFGHKIDVVVGSSNLIRDIGVYHGNPADSSNTCPIVKTQIELYGTVPETVVMDGGYNSRANCEKLREMGIKERVFSRKRALSNEKMGVTEERFQVLKNFRTGVERSIGRLKGRFGFDKVTYKGFDGFVKQLWHGAFAANLCYKERK
jgi:transposase, IS5 family